MKIQQQKGLIWVTVIVMMHMIQIPLKVTYLTSQTFLFHFSVNKIFIFEIVPYGKQGHIKSIPASLCPSSIGKEHKF